MQQSHMDLSECKDLPIADLYQLYAYTLLSFIRQYVPTPEDAEDVLLEVFLAAFEQDALVGLREDEQLAWLRRVARNKCVDAHRRLVRHPVVPLAEVEETMYDDERQAPEQIVLRSEEHAVLHAHLAELSALQQEVLRLRFASGLRSAEIARTLNKREGAIRMLLSRALNLLRTVYEKQ
jgi:RNA polymerase sigma factor (sigma-70 family)